MTRQLPIPESSYSIQYATGEPDPGYHVLLYFAAEVRACFEARLPEEKLRALEIELCQGQRGPVCDELVAGADAAREAS